MDGEFHMSPYLETILPDHRASRPELIRFAITFWISPDRSTVP
jgi:hypothetical protein